MSKVQYIAPETVAHFVASTLSNNFLMSSGPVNYSSLDDTEIRTTANNAAMIYAIAYDEVYDKINKFNDDLVHTPEQV